MDIETFDTDMLLDKFHAYYCIEQLQIEKSALAKLQQDGILCIKVVRNFLIVKDYIAALETHNNYSMKAAEEISVKYSMTTRQIQNIIYKWENRFRKMGERK